MLGKRSRFESDLAWIDRQTNNKFPTTEARVQLRTDLCKPLIGEEFTCLICSEVVWEPKECNYDGCATIYCSRCIDGWFQNGKTRDKNCPNCSKADEAQFRKLNRHLRARLEKFRFTCPEENCAAKFHYNEAQQHVDNFHRPSTTCNLCSESKQPLMGKEAYVSHLRDSCVKARLTCSGCSKGLKRG